MSGNDAGLEHVVGMTGQCRSSLIVLIFGFFALAAGAETRMD